MCGDAWRSATALRTQERRPEGWGTDYEICPQPFGEGARMRRGRDPVEGSALPRPRRNGCNRTRCRGTPDYRRPHGRIASVHRSRTTPWLNRPVSMVEGARRSVSLSVTRCFDMLVRRRGEKWARAIAEQAQVRSGHGWTGCAGTRSRTWPDSRRGRSSGPQRDWGSSSALR
jgi:hypothetical protein